MAWIDKGAAAVEPTRPQAAASPLPTPPNSQRSALLPSHLADNNHQESHGAHPQLDGPVLKHPFAGPNSEKGQQDSDPIGAQDVAITTRSSNAKPAVAALSWPSILCNRVPFRRISPTNPFSDPAALSSSSTKLPPLPKPRHAASCAPTPLPSLPTEPPPKRRPIQKELMTYVFRGQHVSYWDPDDSSGEDDLAHLSSDEDDRASWQESTFHFHQEARAKPRFRPKRLFAAELNRRASAAKKHQSAQRTDVPRASSSSRSPHSTLPRLPSVVPAVPAGSSLEGTSRSPGPIVRSTTATVLTTASEEPDAYAAPAGAPAATWTTRPTFPNTGSKSQTCLSTWFPASTQLARAGTAPLPDRERNGKGKRTYASIDPPSNAVVPGTSGPVSEAYDAPSDMPASYETY